MVEKNRSVWRLRPSPPLFVATDTIFVLLRYLAMRVLLLALLSLLSFSSLSAAQSSSSQSNGLLSLKGQWRDPRQRLVDWSSASHYCSWTGVSCRNNSVIALILRRFRLQGNLSNAIQLLPDLQTLDLSNNALSGAIPSEIGMLTSLSTLDLSRNGFSGELSGNGFANLSLLLTLNLAFNRLQGSIPPQLGSLSSLQTLQLRQNLLSGSIPQSLANAVSLRYLLLDNNMLSGAIPPGIGLLPHLKYLAVASNSLNGVVPPDWVNLRGIVAIYAGSNELNGTLPEGVGNLTRLIRLDLQENRFEGEIPPSIASLAQLRELVLSNNRLSGSLPSGLGELRNLTVLDLSRNNISGDIPAEVGNLSLLQNLDLQQNNFSGTISPYLGNLSSLQSLNLSYNNLSGEVPENGVLSNFSASSFEGNPLLCGGPLDLRCSSPPPAPSPTPGFHPRSTPPALSPGGSRRISRNTIIIISVVAGVVGLILLPLLFYCLLSKGKETIQDGNRLSAEPAERVPNSKMVMYLRDFKFSYEEIVSQAGYYDTAHVLGKGRFAAVYRSSLPGGFELAVKVFKNPIPQSAFERQVEQLSALHFRNLLPIRGYYSNPVEKVIFYDLIPRGTLYDLLYPQDKDLEPVHMPDWSQRLLIALGIAQALAYLHRGSSSHFVHGDLKSTNVLLSDDLSPLVSDYCMVGLVCAKSRAVETRGYAPPELRSTRRYSEKSDVYAFGVVLLELLTRKKPVSFNGDRELYMVSWVTRLHKDGRGREVLDPLVVDTCPSPDDYLERALKLAIHCLSTQPSLRPQMSEVVTLLERLADDHPPVSPESRTQACSSMASEPEIE